MKKHLNNINNDYIRYANCWEDADVLLNSLDIRSTDKILSIGSAGDNSFSMLVANPQKVVAVDINHVQLHLIELKKAAYKALNHHQFLSFLGFENNYTRLSLWPLVATELPTKDFRFWSNKIDTIEAGIIHQGKFENYFKLFRTKVLPLIHKQKRIDQLFACKSEEEQKKFYDQTWNNWRWEKLFKVFFSKFILGRLGRDPKFLQEVEVPVSEFILDKAEGHLSLAACQKNYFLKYILLGEFGPQLPHYARKENFDLIKTNIDRLKIFCGFAQDAAVEFGPFDKFNLSNIFEYMDPAIFDKTCKDLYQIGNKGARYAYWNLMVPRKMSIQISSIQSMIQNFGSRIDKGFFYGNFQIDLK